MAGGAALTALPLGTVPGSALQGTLITRLAGWTKQSCFAGLLLGTTFTLSCCYCVQAVSWQPRLSVP